MAMTAQVPPAERPTYTTKEAARYADTSPQSVARWRAGYVYPTLGGPKKSPPITTGETAGLLSFNDLVEVAVAAAARQAGVPMKAVRIAVATARGLYGVTRPLMEVRFQHDGRSLFTNEADLGGAEQYVNLSRHGQTAWKHIVEVLKDLDYDANDIAYRWWPAGRDEPIIIDPAVSFGRPYIVGRQVSTDAVRSRFIAKESLPEIADDLDLTVQEAEAALRFEYAPAA